MILYLLLSLSPCVFWYFNRTYYPASIHLILSKINVSLLSSSFKLSIKSTVCYFLHFNPTVLPVAATSMSCSPDMVDGYFRSKSARCTCSLSSEGYPRGTAQWYREGGQTVAAGSVLDVTYDKNSE